MQQAQHTSLLSTPPQVKQETPATDALSPPTPAGAGTPALGSAPSLPRYKGRASRTYVSKVPLSQADERIASQAFTRAIELLTADQAAAVSPDVDTAFSSVEDAVKRLLPYHIFQLPDKGSGKGKRKATEVELIREELAETRFAIECHRRKRKLDERLRQARLGAGRRKVYDDQAYYSETVLLEAEKSESSALNAELKTARVELDRLEREKRAATAPTKTTTTFQSSSISSSGSLPGTSSAGTGTTTPATSYQYQYRSYQYPYASTQSTNTYPSQYPYSYYAPSATANATATVTATSAASTPLSKAATPAPSSSSASSTTSVTTMPSMSMPRGPVPLQLPATVLPRLNALGIFPVPRATSAATPPPNAILVGTSAGGTTLHLEVNLAALQPPQMTGLAEVLTQITQQPSPAGVPPVQPYAQMGAPYVYTPSAGGVGSGKEAGKGT
ncbi:hypothetical protein K488DRAFT_81694 [Vararia minispora EC-137]|uniref:Uncharacterized protein n=1 Tax=Vararia minispora EC-137 TaxID=1314806 RepID=A0ACB8QZG8_9AGAM|nr:hypothetical protein K488DRAFT_81694 [Vararia minispora EC-137]